MSHKNDRLAREFPPDAGRIAPVTGFTSGTNILTLDGEIAVEFLNVGDRVVTRRGMRILRAITATVTKARGVCVASHSLGHGRPDRDTVLAPDTLVLVRDWRAKSLFGAPEALVPVSRLMDGAYVKPTAATGLRVFTLEFDEQYVLYADGMEVASRVPVRVDA
ncbi:Hint domain-containing protein [Pseudogemmobacter sp. W21_MBD1_M6]|uniref:Hint domain-containing protein n=1 Tax=Pseudogemmobacter sp. W21_MBD1_M6 TaxID=3240271 RepID=UPI003F9974BF